MLYTDILWHTRFMNGIFGSAKSNLGSLMMLYDNEIVINCLNSFLD